MFANWFNVFPAHCTTSPSRVLATYPAALSLTPCPEHTSTCHFSPVLVISPMVMHPQELPELLRASAGLQVLGDFQCGGWCTQWALASGRVPAMPLSSHMAQGSPLPQFHFGKTELRTPGPPTHRVMSINKKLGVRVFNRCQGYSHHPAIAVRS